MENRLITEQLAEQIAKYPLYSQDGLGKAAICIGILELANIKWYVLEGQQEGNDYTLFTIVAGLAETEYGYTSANELASIQVDGSKYGLGTLQVQQQVELSNSFRGLKIRKKVSIHHNREFQGRCKRS